LFFKKKEYSDSSVKEYFGELDDRTSDGSKMLRDSLDDLKPSDLLENDDGTADEKAAQKKRRRNASSLVSGIMAAVFGAVFLYCAYQLVLIAVQYVKSDNFYGGIADSVAQALGDADKVSVSKLEREEPASAMQSFSAIREEGVKIYDPADVSRTRYSARFLSALVQIESYRSKNEDIFGFINVDSTKIRYYPLVQAKDNDYYLTHDVDKNNRNSGAIFVDYRNDRVLSNNRNTVIYGHNMENGGMFHGLLNYMNESFFNDVDIVIYTAEGIYTYTVFSIYPTVASADYFRTSFYSDRDFIDFCLKEEENSIFHKSGIEFGPDSVILTLSTCITGLENGRYAIHAVLTCIDH